MSQTVQDRLKAMRDKADSIVIASGTVCARLREAAASPDSSNTGAFDINLSDLPSGSEEKNFFEKIDKAHKDLKWTLFGMAFTQSRSAQERMDLPHKNRMAFPQEDTKLQEITARDFSAAKAYTAMAEVFKHEILKYGALVSMEERSTLEKCVNTLQTENYRQEQAKDKCPVSEAPCPETPPDDIRMAFCKAAKDTIVKSGRFLDLIEEDLRLSGLKAQARAARLIGNADAPGRETDLEEIYTEYKTLSENILNPGAVLPKTLEIAEGVKKTMQCMKYCPTFS